jgi:RNA polymerase sigma factor (sigma-70 family)
LAVNTGRDRLRRIKTRALLHVLMPWRWPTGQEAFERLEQRDELDLALGHLSATIRQTLALYYGADLRVREVAEALGCAEGTVKMAPGHGSRATARAARG